MRSIIIGAISLFLFAIPIGLNIYKRHKVTHIGGLLNLFEVMDISRTNFGWLFLGGLYHIPMIALLLIELIQQEFMISNVGGLLATVSVSSMVFTVCANFQATYIEREINSDTVIYSSLILYYVSFFFPIGFVRDLIGSQARPVYLHLLLGASIIFVGTLLSISVFYLYDEVYQ